MKKEIEDILKQTSIQNQKLIDEMQKSVLGISDELDTFFKNEKEGVIILSIIHRFLIRKTGNLSSPSEYTKDMSLYPEERKIFPKSFDRQREIMEMEEEIKKLISNKFNVKIGRFEKDGSMGIDFSIYY